jgi:hypothetical protein
MHELAQVPLPQAGFALGWIQLKQVGPGPHCVTSVSWAQVLLQRCVPGVEQTKSQLVPLQVAVPVGGALQAVQLVVPQLVTLELLTQAPLQAWKPDWHAQVPVTQAVLEAVQVLPAQQACR